MSTAQRDHLYNLDPNLMAQLLLFSLHLPISGQQLRQEIALKTKNCYKRLPKTAE